MSLIKCSECGVDISNKASSCPKCGNPLNPASIDITQESNKTFRVEPVLTSKKWKMVKLISWGLILLGVLVAPNGASPTLGITILILGIVSLIVGHIGAWYADRRSR